MPRISASSHGDAQIRVLRIVRHGDRDEPRELTVGCRLEGDFAAAFLDGRTATRVSGDALKRLVHAAVRDFGGAEIEVLGLGLCTRLLGADPQVRRARVEIAERAWEPLEAGGRSQLRAFTASGAELKTTAVTSNGSRVAVVSGVDELPLMRTQGPAATANGQGAADVPVLLVGRLGARWTYRSGDVTFGAYRQGVRAAIVDTFSWHDGRSVAHGLYAVADVLLATYEEIADVTLRFEERPFRPVDVSTAGLDNPEDVFVAAEDAVRLVEVRVEREEEAGGRTSP